GEMRRSAVIEIVTIDRGHDDVRKAELRCRFGHVYGFGRVERPGQPGLDVAERASPRARVAHDHERGVLFVPTLADIRATGLFAHGVQAVGAHDPLRLEITGRDRRFDANPIGLGWHRLIGPMRLFWMTRATRFSNAIDQYSHSGNRFRAGI